MISAWFVVLQVAEGLVGVVSAAGNALVLYVIITHKRLHNHTNVLIASLAVADLLVGVVGIPCVIINNFSLPRNNFYGCLLMSSIIVVLTQISIFSLVAIALERFLAIRFPIFHRQKLSSTIVLYIIAFVWISGSLVGFVPMFGWNLGSAHGACDFVFIIDMNYMVFFNFFGFILVPLVVIFATYGYIAYVVKMKCFKTPFRDDTQKIKMKKECKAAMKIFTVILMFAVCWLPIHIINTVTLMHKKTNLDLLICAIILSHVNSAVNPFLYAHGNSKFREACKKTLGIKSSVAPSDLGKHSLVVPSDLGKNSQVVASDLDIKSPDAPSVQGVNLPDTPIYHLSVDSDSSTR